jgi:hypothetical protein
VVLTSPPKVALIGPTLNGIFGHGSDDSSIYISPSLGNGFEISFAPSVIQLAKQHTVSGVTYLFVGTVDSADIYTLYRYHDSNSDDVIDTSTKTTVFTSGSNKAYLTDVAFTSTRWFFLDQRCQDIWIADASAGLPTSISTTPFAKSADHADLLQVRHLEAVSASEVLGSEYRTGDDVESKHRRPVLTMQDTTSDGLADSVSLSSIADHPDVIGAPYDGQSSIDVVASHTDTVRVYKLDSAGAEDVLLGSASATGTIAVPERVSISLSPSLSEGEIIRVRYDSEAEGDEDLEVVDSKPQLLRADTDVLVSNAAATVIIEGLSLATGMTVELWHSTDPDLAPQSLSYTVTSATEISVSVPVLGSSWEGRVMIQAISGSQVIPLRAISLTVVAP